MSATTEPEATVPTLTSNTPPEVVAPAGLQLQVNLEGVTFGDLEMFEAWSHDNKSVKMTDMVGFLDRIIVGGIRKVPITRINEVMAAVEGAISGLANPATNRGN